VCDTNDWLELLERECERAEEEVGEAGGDAHTESAFTSCVWAPTDLPCVGRGRGQERASGSRRPEARNTRGLVM